MSRKTLTDAMREIYGHYPDVIEDYFERKKRMILELPVLADDDQETLRNVYKQVYKIEIINDILHDFRA